MHKTLIRQLKKLGLDINTAPDAETWGRLLARISQVYEDADAERYIMERSLQISSAEISDMHAEQRRMLEGRMTAVVRALPDLLFLFDDQGRYLEVIAGDTERLLLPAEQLRGRLLSDVMPVEQAAVFVAAIQKAIVQDSLQVLRYSLSVPSGERVFEGRVSPTGYKVDGRPTVVFLARDITESLESERHSRLLDTVIQRAREGVVIVAEDRRVLYANPAVGEITGYTPTELMTSGEGFLRHEDDQVLCNTICTEARAAEHWQREIEIHDKEGHARLVWLSLDTLRNQSGEIEYFVGVLNDVTAIRQSRTQLEHLASHDNLTGLPNRSAFEERLQAALSRAQRHNITGALLLLDLDRFKEVNDSLGHSVGDSLLMEVARRLQAVVRREDMVARLGGDEFTLILEDVDSAIEVSAVAEKILEVFAEPVVTGDLQLDVATSIGITLFPSGGDSLVELLRQADAAMYEAKEAGGSQYSYHSEQLSEIARSRLALQGALRKALNERELTLLYQPQFRLRDGVLEGFEALLRWPGATGQVHRPDEFIPVAELSGLIEPLGLWVIEEALKQAMAWQHQGMDYRRIAVNVSGRQLGNPNFADEVAALLEHYDIPGSRLEVEITESTEVSEGGIRHRNLDQLHALGIGLAIDDFGTGHSSLVNLKRFPLSRLKIDRSFIRDVGQDPNDEAIVGAIVALGRQLGLAVVAEGVEAEHQSEFLADLDCDVVQGFLFAKPMSPQNISANFGQLNQCSREPSDTEQS